MSAGVSGAVQTIFQNTDSPVADLPGAAAAGELAICFSSEIHGNAQTGAPSGFTDIGGGVLGSGGDLSTITVARVLTAGDITATTLTLSGINANTNDDGGVSIITLNGMDLPSPLSVHKLVATDHGTQTSVTASLTGGNAPTIDGCLIIAVTLSDPSGMPSAPTPDSSPSTTVELSGLDNNQLCYIQSLQQSTAGDVSIDTTGLTSDTYYTIIMAIAPASSGVSGSLSQTLDDATLSSVSTLDLSATLAQTLDDATLSAVSTLDIDATLSQTLGDATLSSASTIGGGAGAAFPVSIFARLTSTVIRRSP